MLHFPTIFLNLYIIIWKDFLIEIRNQSIVLRMMMFSLTLLVIMQYVIPNHVNFRSEITPGILWINFIFMGILGINRITSIEMSNSCYEGMLLTPISRTIYYFGKVLSGLIFIVLAELIITLFYTLLFNVNLINALFFLICLLGSLGYMFLGTLLSMMSINAHNQEMLLSLLLFPLLLPLVIPCVKATAALLSTPFIWGEYQMWLSLIIAYDVIMISSFYLLVSFIERT